MSEGNPWIGADDELDDDTLLQNPGARFGELFDPTEYDYDLDDPDAWRKSWESD